jgi:uncharacterized protein (DUF2141 family)
MPSGLQKYFYSILKLLVPSALVLYAVACATIVSPTGGPKDITPPSMLNSEPQNLSTNFKGDRLILNFDEYINLKTPEKFLLISPPLGKEPDIRVKGRSIIIKMKDTLRANTTYNFYLGEAIVDITESNPVPNFNFAFSTGPEIDSLSLAGNVTDAFTRQPMEGALVMLYTDFTDSVPMKQIPTYVSRTSKKGDFRLNNLASGKYRAVALVDGNSDYMYNLPSETIGFSSDTVVPYYSAVSANDTNVVVDKAAQLLVSIDMFPEPDSTQRILKSVIAAKNRLSVAFRYSAKTPEFRALNIPDSLPWAVIEWNKGIDTLNAWLLNKPDTLKLEVLTGGTVLDTVEISTNMKVTGRPQRNTETKPKLGFTASSKGGALGYGRPLMLTFANPVKEYNTDSIALTVNSATDTTVVKPLVKFTDSIQRHLLITHNWNQAETYNLYIPKGSFTDIYSDSCDSTRVAFQMTPIEEYGEFAVSINRQQNDFPVIIQLLNEKGLVVDEKIVTTEKRIDFGLLPPAKYGLKAIMDTNKNGRWDTGQFINKIQPERVLVHPKLFEVRTNWELEETWDL